MVGFVHVISPDSGPALPNLTLCISELMTVVAWTGDFLKPLSGSQTATPGLQLSVTRLRLGAVQSKSLFSDVQYLPSIFAVIAYQSPKPGPQL